MHTKAEKQILCTAEKKQSQSRQHEGQLKVALIAGMAKKNTPKPSRAIIETNRVKFANEKR